MALMCSLHAGEEPCLTGQSEHGLSAGAHLSIFSWSIRAIISSTLVFMAYADVAAGASESPNPRRSGTMTLYPASRSGFICINIIAQN